MHTEWMFTFLQRPKKKNRWALCARQFEVYLVVLLVLVLGLVRLAPVLDLVLVQASLQGQHPCLLTASFGELRWCAFQAKSEFKSQISQVPLRGINKPVHLNQAHWKLFRGWQSYYRLWLQWRDTSLCRWCIDRGRSSSWPTGNQRLLHWRLTVEHFLNVNHMSRGLILVTA